MRTWSIVLVLSAAGLCATPAETLFEEQLNTLTNQDVKSTIKILRRLNKFFLLDHEEQTPAPTPTEAQRQHGYILFTRNYLEEVYYNTNPRPHEIKNALKLFATPGEYEPVSFAVWPIEELKGATVAAADLHGPQNALLPKTALDIRVTRQLARGIKPFMYMVGPEALEPLTSVNIPAGRTTQFWITVKVPADQAPGEYKGILEFRPDNKPASEVELTVVVLPFKLLEDPGMNFGWYYGGNPQTLRRELEDMRAHGCTTLTIPEPQIKKVTPDGQVEVDFTVWEQYRKLCTETGLNGTKQTGIGGITGAIVQQGIKELGPGFDLPFVAVLRKYKEWLDAHPDFKVVFVIYDEPRESLQNAWNRNYDQTMAYIKLCRQVPGVLVSVNPMGDQNGDKDYSNFAEAVDVLNTHAWEGSKKLIDRTKKAGKELWVYNNGQSRLTWGFGPWKLGARGEWEWMYPGGASPDAYCPIPVGGYENEGESATGRFPVYGFPDRIVPTPRYEWCREGTDDYKYVYTLERKLKNVKSPEVRAYAEDLLEEIAGVIPMYPAAGLKTGAEVAKSGDPAQLLALFDNFRWRIALAILRVEDDLKGLKATDADSLYKAYSTYKFGEIPPRTKVEAKTEKEDDVIQVEKTTLTPGAKIIFDFETDDCLKQLETDRSNEAEPFDPNVMPAKRVKRAASFGEYSLFYEPVEKGGGLHLINFDGNWAGFDFLRIDFYNPSKLPVNGWVTISDEATRVPPNYPGGRAMGFYDDRYDSQPFAVPPGKFTYELRIGGLSTNGGRQMDLAKIKKIALGCWSDQGKVPYYIDCIRVEKEETK